MDPDKIKTEIIKEEELMIECEDDEKISMYQEETDEREDDEYVYDTTDESESQESSNEVSESYYSCSHCEFKTKYKGGLKSHKDSKHFGRVFLCQFCGKKYHDHSNMNRHIRISHWKKQSNKRLKPATMHNCIFCDFHTTRKENLQLHMNSLHTLEKVYPCEICSYIGTRADSYRRHVKSMHEEKKKEYKCSRCRFRTARRDFYNSHFENAHVETKQTFPCKFCHYRATFICNLRRHVQRIHA